MGLTHFKAGFLLFIFLWAGAFMQVSLAKKAKTSKQKWGHFLEKREKKAPPQCKSLSVGCAICSDGKMRVSTYKSSKVSSKKLKISPYACAHLKAPLWNGKRIPASKLKGAYTKGCRILSDFCAVCKDGSYLFTKTGAKIDIDLYACATSPRTRIYKNP